MPSRWTINLVLLLVHLAVCSFARADDTDSPKPSQIEFQLPAGAKIFIDGKDLGEQRTLTLDNFKPNEIRRLKAIVTFADGAEDERLIDVEAGQRILVAVPKPGKDKAVAVATQTLTPVIGAALSHGGRYVAVGLENGALVLWDTAAGRPTRTFLGHRGAIQAVKFSGDDRSILTGSVDGTAILWDLGSGRQVQVFKGHTAAVMAVAFSPDARRVLTGSVDKTAILWDAATGRQIRAFNGHRKEVFGVDYSPDGATVATASFDLTTILWDAETGKEKTTLRGHREEVSCVAFSRDGRLLVTGSYENKGIVWEVAGGKKLATSGKHESDVYSVTFTPDGTRFITGDRDGVLMMWDVASGKKLRDFIGHSSDASAVVISDDRRMMMTGCRDGTVRLWDMATGQELASLVTDATRKNWAVVSPAGYFDGSEGGRQMVGWRFSRLPGAVVDQFFYDYFRPGLLAEICAGQRPLPPKPLGEQLPPIVKIVSPTARVATTQEIKITVEAVDQGGGVADFAIYVNGARSAAAAKPQKSADKKTTRVTFTVALTQGTNKIRVKAASRDGSWEATPAELELTYARPLERKSRMYIVAVGIGIAADKRPSECARNVQVLADFLQRNAAKLYERVDVIPLYDREATESIIEDTLRDVAELTRPQDTLVVLLGGAGALKGDQVLFASANFPRGPEGEGLVLNKRKLALDDVGAMMAGAQAMKRVLILDAAAEKVYPAGILSKAPSEFALRKAVEKVSRKQGIYTIAATPRSNENLDRSLLIQALLNAGNMIAAKGSPDAGGALDVTDWFALALEQAHERYSRSQDSQRSSQSNGFPILMLDKK